MTSITSHIVKYTTAVDNCVINTPEAKTFSKTVDNILSDDRGWKKYGVIFERNNNNDTILVITLVNSEYMRSNFGKSFQNLSCYDPSTVKIYINYENWTGHSKAELNVEDYQCYVINHETGHHLQVLEHIPEPHPKEPCTSGKCGIKCGIMMQMTLNPNCIHSCWPWGDTLKDALQSPHKKSLFGGDVGIPNIFSFNFILIGSIIVAIIIALFLLYHSISERANRVRLTIPLTV